MLQYLILVIQNSIPTAIVIAIMLAYTMKSNENGRKKYVIIGMVSGSVIATILSILKLTTGFVVREYYNAAVLTFTIISSILLLLFLWVPLKQNIKTRVTNIGLLLASCGWLAFMLPDLIMYPSGFAVMSDTFFSTAFLFTVIGYLLGLLISFLTIVFLYKITKELPILKVKIALTTSVLILMTQEILALVQILLNRGVIPKVDWVTEMVICASNHGNWFMYLLLCVAFILTVLLLIQITFTKLDAPNSALLRKLRAANRKNIRIAISLFICGVLAILTVTVGVAYNSKEIVLSDAIPTKVVDGKISIPLESVSDGGLHRFAYTATDGTEMRFIIIQKSEATYGVALDACDICGDAGYYEDDGKVICSLCDVVMNIQTIGFSGGCNPVPIEYELSDGNIVIDTATLEAEKHRFQ